MNALLRAGVRSRNLYTDLAPNRRERPQRDDLLAKVRPGDVIVVETPAPLGLAIAETVRLVRALAAQGIGVRTLTGPIQLDVSRPQSADARHALAILELFQQLDVAYLRERREARRRRAQAEGRRLGRPYAEESPQDAARYAQARQMRLQGLSVLAISVQTGLNRHTLTGYFRRNGIPIPPPGWPPRPGTPPADSQE